MISALIIDDEPHCIERIKSLAAALLPEKLHIMAGLTDYDDALAAIRQYQPDLIFLDIQLGRERTGFDLIAGLGQQPVLVVFTTAYDRYAVKAFRFSALDYLLKPVGADELAEAVQKQSDRNPLVQTSGKIESLLGNLYGAGKRMSIPVSTTPPFT
ncbi:MAG: response regulator [Flavihumibacter sp.]